MATQVLTIGKRRFVLLPEREFLKLKEQADSAQVHPQFAADAMKQLQAYRKTGVATPWPKIKRKSGKPASRRRIFPARPPSCS